MASLELTRCNLNFIVHLLYLLNFAVHSINESTKKTSNSRTNENVPSNFRFYVCCTTFGALVTTLRYILCFHLFALVFISLIQFHIGLDLLFIHLSHWYNSVYRLYEKCQLLAYDHIWRFSLFKYNISRSIIEILPRSTYRKLYY